MRTENDWLKAICDNPYDLNLRLVYADWLDEHEYPAQAADIRRDDCSVGDFDPTQYGFINWTCKLGFLSKIKLPIHRFMGQCEILFRSQPVTEVLLSDKRPQGSILEREQDAYTHYGWGVDDGELERTLTYCQETGFTSQDFASRLLEIPDDELPLELWEHLAEPTLLIYDTKLYKGREAARKALSRACVDFGRKRVGLSPINWESHAH